METQVINATEYRNVTLAVLSESKTNPRRTFEETALKELADPSAARAFSRLCSFALSRRTASRSSQEHGVTAPRRSRNSPPCPSVSSTCPMPQHWRHN